VSASPGERGGGEADCPKWGGMSKTCTMLNACQIERYTGFWALPGAPGVDTFSTALASPATNWPGARNKDLWQTARAALIVRSPDSVLKDIGY